MMMTLKISMMLTPKKSEILERRLILLERKRAKINKRRKYSIGHVYLVVRVKSIARIRRRLERHLECR